MQLRDLYRINALIPGLKRVHWRIERHLAAVRRGRGHRCRGIARLGVSKVSPDNGDARGRLLEIPPPRGELNLLEVVDGEDQVPLWYDKAAEVLQLCAAARLNGDATDRSAAEIEGCDRRGSAHKRKWRVQHAPTADRDQ